MNQPLLAGEIHEEPESLSDWRLIVQEKVYQILEIWMAESMETIRITQEFRDKLAEAMVYGDYKDQARAMKILLEMTKLGLDSIMRIIGQFDNPGHVSSTLNEGNLRGERRPYEAEVEVLDPVQREQLVIALRGLVTEVKGMVATRPTLPASPATP